MIKFTEMWLDYLTSLGTLMAAGADSCSVLGRTLHAKAGWDFQGYGPLDTFVSPAC